MASGNDLEAMRNRLKDILRGPSSGSVKKNGPKTPEGGQIGIKSVHHVANDRVDMLKEINDLNKKLLALERTLDADRVRFAKEKRHYTQMLGGMEEKVAKMKGKVAMANERIADLEGTLKLKNDRIAALTAELEMEKPPKSKSAHDSYSSQGPQNGDYPTHRDYDIDLSTRKLMELNLRTMEFEYDPSLDQTTKTKITHHSLPMDGDTMDLLMKRSSNSADFKSPIYNSNPASKSLDSDDEMYLQTNHYLGRRSSFDLDSALKDSTEKIAGIH